MKKRIFAFVLFCMCFAVLLPCASAISTADAKEPIRVDEECSLTLNYGIEGLRINIYRVADVSSDFRYTLTEEFEDTRLDLNGIVSSAEWSAVGTTLEGYIYANGIEMCETVYTDGDGVCGAEELSAGLYYVMPLRVIEGGVKYSFSSVLVSVPSLGNNGEWIYDVYAKPKSGSDSEETTDTTDTTNTTDTTGSDTTDTGDSDTTGGESTSGDHKYKVVKLWRDGNGGERSETVEIDIIRNGEIVETVILSDANNWSYSWISEDGDHDSWIVSERNVPNGYISSVEVHENTFTVINYAPSESDPPKTGESSNLGLYIVVMCVSGVALTVVGLTGKKNAKKSSDIDTDVDINTEN